MPLQSEISSGGDRNGAVAAFFFPLQLRNIFTEDNAKDVKGYESKLGVVAPVRGLTRETFIANVEHKIFLDQSRARAAISPRLS